MTNAELAKFVDRGGILTIDKLGVLVHSLDAREAYGRLDVLVEPVQGTGKVWVAESRIAWSTK